MKKIDFKVSLADNSYAQFCTRCVQIAGNFESKIEIVVKNLRVDLKSILGLMSLCLQNEKFVTIEIEGNDEVEAEEQIRKLILN